ncbi:TRAP transporter small permease subunit [Hylemonella sp. W303a]|uniref:TRAP transporter small permease subunit n=1 Tax=Hylemonella sp. W303a TaxID=3389873 RepID=UPI00396B18DE
MQKLLKFSRLMDSLSSKLGGVIIWLILASTLISAVNAIVRKTFDTSSNAFLEIQWYLFSASFLLAAGYTLLNNEHVRIDVVSSRLSSRARAWIDVFGFAVFLTPVCLAVLYFSLPFFMQAFRSGEVSGNAGGLIRWPVYLMLPLGFTLLLLQGWSELIKRVAFLRGLIDDPMVKKGEKSAEEALAEAIREREAAAAAALKN